MTELEKIEAFLEAPVQAWFNPEQNRAYYRLLAIARNGLKADYEERRREWEKSFHRDESVHFAGVNPYDMDRCLYDDMMIIKRIIEALEKNKTEARADGAAR